MILFRHPASLLRRTESLRTTLIAVAFWALAVIALTNLRDLHLWGLPQVDVIIARATMACSVLLLGLVGVRCVIAWRESGSLAPIRRTLGGTPGMVLFAAIASYLAIGASVLGVEAIREPDTAGSLRYYVLHFGVLAAAAVGGRAVLERTGVDRLLQGVLLVLIASCAIILASPILRDLDVLPPYRLPFRLTGAFLDPNDASLVTCMTVALAAALLTNGGPRALAWLGLAAGVAAGLATTSRTALVVLGTLAVVFLLINVRNKLKVIVLASAGAGLVGVAGFVGLAEWSESRNDPDYASGEKLLCGHPPADGPGADCAVLLAARDILAGDIVLNWRRAVPVNRWQGVTVDGPEGRVTRLELTVLGLNGRIPSDLGRLDRLVRLSLPHNRLAGRIPPELGNLASLESLNLNHNTLTGAIPPELAKLENLKELRLVGNRLTGPVPAALGGLDLSILRLRGSDFDSIPPELAAIGNTSVHAPPCTPLPSTSPVLYDDCTVLLAVKDTLAGEAELNWHPEIPIGLWDGVTVGGPQGRVTRLWLGGRGLNGRIPPELGRLDGLVQLNLAANRLTGPVPPELGRLVGLRRLSLDRNDLTGPVPPELLDIPAHDLGYLGFCAPPSPPTSPPLYDDCTVLLAVKDTLAGEAKLNWHPEIPVSSWDGVTVGGPQGRVTRLWLGGRGLNGRIPPELGRLDGLVSLNLGVNRLTGPVPPELGRLVGLRVLSLGRNDLTGAIPAELGQLGRLESLWLGENRLTGLVPPELLEIPEHDLGDFLVCLPPPEISPALYDDCTVLLAVKDTLAGEAELNWHPEILISSWDGVTVGGSQGRVTRLLLGGRGLNGRIPPELGRLDGLVDLNLAANRLTGPVPPELGRLVGLRVLSLGSNDLTGAIPAELGQLGRLESLWLGENRLTGDVSPELLEIPEHDLGDYLVCLPPPQISPALFDDCARLLAMKDTLAGNARLNWSVVLPIGEWQGVTVGGPETRVIALELPRMGLNGRIPAALGDLVGLRSLVLDGNVLTGAIPPELGNLTDLEMLGLAANALSGPIPPELAKLSSLGELWLSGNRLTGSLPPELRSVAGGEAPCPAAPADNPGLRADCALLLATRDVLAGDARLNWSEHVPIEFWQGVTIGGSLERVTGLDLRRSGLNGRIPPALGRLSQLVQLALNRNRLTGPVPPELGKLTKLERLALSFNALSGPIPPELGKLSHLRALWLWNNRLSGPVPPELQGLEKLSLLRLSGNDLDHPYPPRLFGIANRDFGLHDLPRRRGLGDAETAGAADRRTNRDRPDAVRRLFCRPSSDIASDLRADCALLLASRDVLAGGAPLNWSEDIPVEFWQGVTVGGAPKRVTALELPRAGLNGRLFAELGELGGLVALNLSHNRISGSIPPGLGGLEHLVSLRLEGNRLTGPAPPELEGLDNLLFLRLAGNDLNRPFPPALHEVVDHDLDTPVFCRPKKIDPGLLADCTLLLTVRDALAGDAPLNWREEAPVDDWLGVVMDRSRGRVTALELTQMGLDGRIPAELGQLAGLVSLRLGRNRLAGGIPPELGNLVALRVLALDGNLLAGSIPPELGKLSRLTDLWLHGNRLIGPAPPSVAALPELVVLRLDDDDAAGEPPAQDRARARGFDRNLLCQSLPGALSRLHDDCTTLLDARDVLAGDVELNWSDAVPVDYWRGVTVGLPAIAGEAAEGLRVIALDLSHTGLNGRIPAELSALDALAVLRLGHNRLAGSIPPELGALSGLRTLNLENNALTGTIPDELGTLQGLVSLRLGNNELTGFTWKFNALTNLRVLASENTGLSGKIDPLLGNLSRLEELRLENNRLYGGIPRELDGLAGLAVLRLGGNVSLYCIPAMSRAAQVRHNDLESSDLLCEASPWSKPGLFDDGALLMRLRDVLAGTAALNWSYATPVASWQGVSVGRRGSVYALDLRDMNLTGRIPPELGELSHLTRLRLDGNRLTGPVPPELAKLTHLFKLSLDGNRLTGPVPPELANLPNLRALWLTDNRLTGSIPPALAGIERLSLAVAGNDFRDCMPQELHRLRSHDIDDGLICAALATERPLLWRLGFEKAMEAPVFGHGLGALGYMEGAPIGHHGRPLGTHNLYLRLLGEAGIVPLLLFVSAIVLLLRAQWAAPKSLARDATVAGVVVIALYCMAFQHLLGVGAFMFLAGLSIATGTAHDDGDRHVAKA